MTIASTPEAMSSRSSHSPAIEVEEPRKKGSRGGKRSVTHLSKAQLARKRANDREAQRNIRQRTKEHIENLEKKVKELEGVGRSSSMERVLKRNQELEVEIERLRSQLSSSQSTSPQMSSDMAEDMYAQPKNELQWIPDSTRRWPETIPSSHLPTLDSNADVPVSMAMTQSTYGAQDPAFQSSNMQYDQDLYNTTATPIWNDPAVFGQQRPQTLSKPTAAWTPFHPAFSQPSRFADLQQSGFTDLVNNPSSTNTTCWQSQPSVYAWQISTKLKAPVTLVDQLMFSVIQTQRHLAITSDLTGEDLFGPNIPPVHVLFNQPGPAKPPSSLTEVMERYSAVLSSRGFALIPEKLASFMCMYRFVQWQIMPTHQTFKTLHDWQAPRPAQLLIEHPAWMDLPPWGKFREKVIENQDRYDNPEFQNDYASNLSVNFPYDPMKALVFKDGQIVVSQLLEKHLSDISNMSMKRPFADKYPEFNDVCRFDEV